MSRRAGVSVRTVRYYEEKGLLMPSGITSGGIRLYSLRDLNKLIFIRQLLALGLNIEEIKMSLGMPVSPGRKARVEYTLQLLDMLKSKLGEELNNVTSLKQEVEHSVELVNRCLRCAREQCPENCPSAAHIL